MLRITRFIKKEKLFELINDQNVAKFELKTRYNRQLKDKTVVKINIYVKINKDAFYDFIDKNITKSIKENNEIVLSTLDQTKRNGFLKESAFDDFGKNYPPCMPMIRILNKYTQQYFWDL